MSDKPETLSAVLAEMRAAAKSTDLFNGEEVGEPLIRGTKVEEWADRIEAAVEQEAIDAELKWTRIGYDERKAEEKSAPGNAAAMREALERIVGCCEGCHADACEKVCRPELTSESIHAALSALAAPARNCDRFATLDEARKAFQDLRGHKILADVELWDSMDEAGALVRWFFAPAEGGDHA